MKTQGECTEYEQILSRKPDKYPCGNQQIRVRISEEIRTEFSYRSGNCGKIVREAGVTKDDFVLEIGPGIGTMTQILCENAREVAAVEIDRKLIPILNDTLSEYDNVTIINDDILKVDINKLAEEKTAAVRLRS